MADNALDTALSDLSLTDGPGPARFHPSFNSAEGDLILVSADGVKFKFDKARLAAKSGMFRDMFDMVATEGEGVDEVPLAESGDVLEVILTNCNEVHDISIHEGEQIRWSVLKALDKYEIAFDFPKLVASLEQKLRPSSRTSAGVAALVGLYLLAFYFNAGSLAAAVGHIMVSEHPWTTLAPHMSSAEAQGVTDGGKLSDLFERRRIALAEQRELLYAETVQPHDEGVLRSGLAGVKELRWCLDAWEDSAAIMSLAELESYDRARRPRPWPGGFFNYKALRKILAKLPKEIV